MKSILLIIFLNTYSPKGENTKSPIDHNSMVLGDSDNNVYLHVSEEIHTWDLQSPTLEYRIGNKDIINEVSFSENTLLWPEMLRTVLWSSWLLMISLKKKSWKVWETRSGSLRKVGFMEKKIFWKGQIPLVGLIME